MPSTRGGRYGDETAVQDLSSLSQTLARVQRISDTNTTTMARKIGYAIGVELASKRSATTTPELYSELSTLFRRLNLGKVTLREWDPLVFVTHANSKSKGLETAFSEGVLEGVMHVRSKVRVFFKHSVPEENAHRPTHLRLHQKAIRGRKL